MKTIDSNKTYILACSGGSDSLALLNMCKNKNIVCAHVNYHARKSSDRDENIVREYCEKNGIKLEVLEVNNEHEGNFEAWARKVRYDFFTKLKDKYQAEAVIVAHHLDDLLETYLIQKDRGSIPLYWGLNKVSDYEGLKIIRPLLKYTKDDLYKYCEKHHLEYGIDETNFLDIYKRNKYRKELNSYSKEEKEDLLKEIKIKNKELKGFYRRVKNNVKYLNSFNYDKYFSLEDSLRYEVLRKYLIDNKIDARHYTVKRLENLDKVIRNKENYLKEMDGKWFDYSYGKLKIITKCSDYSYIVNNGEVVKSQFFTISDNGKGVEAVTLSESDYPLTIRNYKDKDYIEMRFGKKAINRFFIDRKICLSDRLIWPIVLNKSNKVILVPGLGCDIEHYSTKPTLFVIKSNISILGDM